MKAHYNTLLKISKLDFAVLFFRVFLCIMLLFHGTRKLITLFGDDPIQFMDPIGIGAVTSFVLSFIAEFICAILVLLGAWTRIAVVPIIINMLVAATLTGSGDFVFFENERPLLYLLGFIMIFYTGAGRFSLDNLIYKKKYNYQIED